MNPDSYREELRSRNKISDFLITKFLLLHHHLRTNHPFFIHRLNGVQTRGEILKIQIEAIVPVYFFC